MCSFPRDWVGPVPGGGAMSVDWAALAQQWIMMKESCPPAPSLAGPAPPDLIIPVSRPPPQPPLPPPAPSISAGIEGGEAPMEVDSNDMEVPTAPQVSSQEWNSDSSANWRNSWEQWNCNWNQQSNDMPNKMPLATAESPYPGYSTDGNFNKFNNQQGFHPGYWSTGEGAAADDDSNTMRPRRVLRPPPPELIGTIDTSDVDTTLTIDAAKRRKLPAWIRDGLEKMEREKQKQQEREKEKEEFLKQKLLEDSNKIQKQNDDVPALPVKSKFDSDSGESDEEKSESKPRKPVKAAIPPPVIQLSKEEYMQEIMLCVRRTLTEILLDVTTEQILSVCQEEVNRNKSRIQATQGVSVASKSQAFSAISGLGLGIYGDSSDSDSGDSDNDSSSKDYRKKEDISDKQLQESINRQKAEFEKASKEIEARLASEEEALLKARSPNEIGKEENLNKDSDGEDTSNNYRNDKSTSKQRKPSRSDTPPLPGNAKSEKYDSKKKSKKKVKRSDSYDKKKDKHNKRDDSASSRSSSISSSRSSRQSRSSDSQKRSFSDESRSSSVSSNSKSSSKRKLVKKDKSRENKKHKKSKHVDEPDGNDDSNHSSRKKLDRSDNGSDRTSRSRTPDRKYSSKSKYSRRSRSHSSDRRSSRNYDYSKSSRSTRSSYERRRDRSRSRDYRDRSRERRGYSRDRRDYDRRAYRDRDRSHRY